MELAIDVFVSELSVELAIDVFVSELSVRVSAIFSLGGPVMGECGGDDVLAQKTESLSLSSHLLFSFVVVCWLAMISEVLGGFVGGVTTVGDFGNIVFVSEVRPFLGADRFVPLPKILTYPLSCVEDRLWYDDV